MEKKNYLEALRDRGDVFRHVLSSYEENRREQNWVDLTDLAWLVGLEGDEVHIRQDVLEFFVAVGPVGWWQERVETILKTLSVKIKQSKFCDDECIFDCQLSSWHDDRPTVTVSLLALFRIGPGLNGQCHPAIKITHPLE